MHVLELINTKVKQKYINLMFIIKKVIYIIRFYLKIKVNCLLQYNLVTIISCIDYIIINNYLYLKKSIIGLRKILKKEGIISFIFEDNYVFFFFHCRDPPRYLSNFFIFDRGGKK